MNKSLSTFLGIAVTVLSISAFLFFIGYNMIGDETTEYDTQISAVDRNLPDGQTGSNN
ncbi:hypothetical protein [Ferdinandcohnia sp. SAFN-114]|uniref:hypothetical protein n=1 Tax=Ferdinandcohnia sp. SAFN-114 TaxID=3387275 RepID=UPI003F7D9A73